MAKLPKRRTPEEAKRAKRYIDLGTWVDKNGDEVIATMIIDVDKVGPIVHKARQRRGRCSVGSGAVVVETKPVRKAGT